MSSLGPKSCVGGCPVVYDPDGDVKVDILPSANPGSFEMQVISGYGMRRTGFTVNVILPELHRNQCKRASTESVLRFQVSLFRDGNPDQPHRPYTRLHRFIFGYRTS